MNAEGQETKIAIPDRCERQSYCRDRAERAAEQYKKELHALSPSLGAISRSGSGIWLMKLRMDSIQNLFDSDVKLDERPPLVGDTEGVDHQLAHRGAGQDYRPREQQVAFKRYFARAKPAMPAPRQPPQIS